MSISIWYVYLDELDSWLGDNNTPVVDITHAREFFNEETAKKAADKYGGMALGFCQ